MSPKKATPDPQAQEEIRTWIKALAEHAGITSMTDLAQGAGINASTVNRFMRPGVSYLLSTATINKLATTYRFPRPGQNNLDESKVKSLGLGQGVHRCALFTWEKIAMMGLNIEEQTADILSKTNNVVFVRHDRDSVLALEVVDNVMDAIAPAGSIIYIDHGDTELVDDAYYVFRFRGKAIFRRYRANPHRLEPRGMIHRDDSYFPDVHDEFSVVGRVFHIGRDI